MTLATANIERAKSLIAYLPEFRRLYQISCWRRSYPGTGMGEGLDPVILQSSPSKTPIGKRGLTRRIGWSNATWEISKTPAAFVHAAVSPRTESCRLVSFAQSERRPSVRQSPF